MRTFRQNPNPVDIKEFLHRNTNVDQRVDSQKENWDEEYTDLPVPAPTLRKRVMKLGKSVSEKLFSIEFGRISF